MTSPIPRDSLGRIVHEGDVLESGTTIMTILTEYEAKITFPTGGTGFIPLRIMSAINLEASPECTNYERYFADLGTRAEIIRAIVSACGECDECPCTIGDIIELVKGYETVGCFAPFGHWLDEKAVI